MRIIQREHRATRTCGLVLAIAVAAAFVPRGSLAAPLTSEQINEARASFKEGLELEKKADYEGALAKFRATAAIKSTPQVEFHVALCEAKLHRYVEALADLSIAETDAKDQKVSAVTEAAPKLAAEITPLVPKLTVSMADGQPAAAITLDGATLDPTKLGAPMSIDPGKHVIVATAADCPTKTIDVELADGDDRSVVVAFDLPKSEPTEPLPPPPIMPPDDATTPKPGKWSGQRTVGFVVGGVGIASLGVATIFLFMRNSKVSSLGRECVDLRCPPSASSDLDAAHTDVTVSRVTFGVGLVSLGVGTYLVLTSKAPSASSSLGEAPKTGVSFVPAAPGALVGAGLEGAF